ncbi:hypothetical protein D3C72_143470 [compost metagenome]
MGAVFSVQAASLQGLSAFSLFSMRGMTMQASVLAVWQMVGLLLCSQMLCY